MSAPDSLRQPKLLHIQNRKYIGSKHHLLSFIAGVVKEKASESTRFADLFCGSGVVAHYFASRGMSVTAIDHLYHNWVAARCFMGGRPGEVDWNRISLLLIRLEALRPIVGYCAREFGGTYFTVENAGRIDAIRGQIACWVAEGLVSEQEHFVLLTSLIYGADKVANTCGQYDAFLKHLGHQAYSAGGTHQVDAMVYRNLELGQPQVVESSDARVWLGDANQLIDQVECDILYLDPPYNGRQYVDNYHVLENIARWETPQLYGKTRKFARTELKSAYSGRRTAAAALQSLVERARCRHILLSYNNEGIVSDAAILEILGRRGRVEIFTRDYAIFGNGAGRSGRRPIVERLFYCKVESS